MRALITRFVNDEEGADLIEYALLAGLLSLACFLVLTSIGTNLNTLFTGVSTTLSGLVP